MQKKLKEKDHKSTKDDSTCIHINLYMALTHSVASDLGLHYLPISQRKDARLTFEIRLKIL